MSKGFLCYCRISIKEWLDIETEKLHLERFIDETFSWKCKLCCQLFIIAETFQEAENTCNSCFKITPDIDEFGRMHIMWKDNSQYRVFTNLWRSFAQEWWTRNNDLIDKYGYIDVNKYNCKTTQALNSFWNQREPLSCIALALIDWRFNCKYSEHLSCSYVIKYSLTCYRGQLRINGYIYQQKKKKKDCVFYVSPLVVCC